jgi:hypothetical protein
VFGEALFGLLGPLVWSLHFGAIYLGHHLACETALRGRAIDVFVLAITGLGLGVLAFGTVAPRVLRRLAGLGDSGGDLDAFLLAAMRTLCLLSFVGVLWAGAAVLLVAACAQ